jgi:cell division protein FtsB
MSSVLVLCREMLYRALNARPYARAAASHMPKETKRKGPQPRRLSRAGAILRVLLLFVAAVIVVDALVGEQGLLAMRRAQRQSEELARAIARQRAENARLRDEVRRLTEDPAAIEEVARRELGLIRPGETVFIIKDLPPANKP